MPITYSFVPGANAPSLFYYKALIIHGGGEARAHDHSWKEDLAQVLREEPRLQATRSGIHSGRVPQLVWGGPGWLWASSLTTGRIRAAVPTTESPAAVPGQEGTTGSPPSTPLHAR